MDFDLAALTKRTGKTRRSEIELRTITAPQTYAKRLDTIYVSVLRAWAVGAKTRILPAYQRALPVMDGMIRDDAAELQQEIDTIASQVALAMPAIQIELTAWADAVEAYHRARWVQAVFTPTGVDLRTLLSRGDVYETLEAVIARNVALVKDLSAQAQGRLSDIVFRGLTARTNYRKIGQEINEALGLGRKRANLISSNQLQTLTADLDVQRSLQAGIEIYRWRWSRKLHGRPAHIARDGKEFPYFGRGAASELPGTLIHCGCRAQAIVRLDD